MTPDVFRAQLAMEMTSRRLAIDTVAVGCEVSAGTVERWLAGTATPIECVRGQIINGLRIMGDVVEFPKVVP